jgi:hypothetical protein
MYTLPAESTATPVGMPIVADAAVVGIVPSGMLPDCAEQVPEPAKAVMVLPFTCRTWQSFISAMYTVPDDETATSEGS